MTDDFVIFSESGSTHVTEFSKQELISLETPDVFLVSTGEQGPAGPTGESGSSISLEAGEDFVAGAPVYPSGNKFYKASNLNNNGVIGVVREDTLTGFIAQAATCGELNLVGLSSGSKYYLGDGEITTVVPTTGHLQEIGRAVTGSVLLVDIKQSFLLS